MPDATKGSFRAYINPEATHDNFLPGLKGKLVYPLSSQERPLDLWAYKTEKGHIMLSGWTAERPEAQGAKQVEKPEPLKVAEKDGFALELYPNQIILFTNTHKDDDHPDRPDCWGYHLDGSSTLFKIAIWQQVNDSGQEYLTGNLEFTDREHEQDHEEEQEQEHDQEPDRENA